MVIVESRKDIGDSIIDFLVFINKIKNKYIKQ